MNKRKSVLVTSGSKRLGKNISKFFVMNDWDLILHYNNSKVEAEETARREAEAQRAAEAEGGACATATTATAGAAAP